MALRVAINGFGRIGRAAFKIALEHPEQLTVVAINDLGELENLAYLLRYDSIYGRYARTVKVEETVLRIDDVAVKVLREADPANLPWADLQIDVVIESTGFFTTEEGARKHITAGAKRVIISAPTDSEGVATVIRGVNDGDLAKQEVISNGSCTTNCVTPVAAVIEEVFGIEKGLMSTTHAYTATQSLVDGPAKKDWRRGRAATLSIVPSATGAATAVVRALPALAGKFDGLALRVPVPVVSISDFSLLLKRDVGREDINNALREAANNPRYKGVLAVTDEPVVSADFIGDPHSAIVDLSLTTVVAGNLVKIMAWYDNEWGYSNRLIEQVIDIGASANASA